MIHFSKTKNGSAVCGNQSEDDEVVFIDELELRVGQQVCVECLEIFAAWFVPIADLLTA